MKDKQPKGSAKISVAASIQADIEPRRFRELRETLAQTPVDTAHQTQPEPSTLQAQETPGYSPTQQWGPEATEFNEKLAAPELEFQHA